MKKAIIILIMLMILFTLGGCPFFVSAAHTRAHKRVNANGFTEIHKFIDLYFWNYDWEDPYAQ